MVGSRYAYSAVVPGRALDRGSGADKGTEFGAAVIQFVRSRPRPPRMLAFGEPTHGVDELLWMRNVLLRQLVEDAGYRCIAIESCALRSRVVDDALRDGDIDMAMAIGFSHGFGSSRANRELLSWIMAYNRDRPAIEQVHFAGFDAPTEFTHSDSPRTALEGVYAAVEPHVHPADLPASWAEISELIGDDDRWTNPQAMRDPACSIGASPSVAALRGIADHLQRLLASESPRILAADSRNALWDAELCARSATGLLAQHEVMARDTPQRSKLLLGNRDAMMADNLEALADREQDRGPVFVFAHNQHIRRALSGWRLDGQDLRWYGAGALMDVRHGDDYAVIGMAIGTSPGGDPASFRIEQPDEAAGWPDGARLDWSGGHVAASASAARAEQRFPVDEHERAYDAVLTVPGIG